MPKRSKVFLPKWYRWFAIPMLGLVWAIVTYQTFGTPKGQEALGLLGWLAITAAIVLVGVVVWLMSGGKLPAYIIESDTDESA